MNHIIIFSDVNLFREALTSLELSSTPSYEVHQDSQMISTDDVDEVIRVLNSDGIYMFDVEEADAERLPGEDMDGDHDSAMASAGFGTDEDYGHFGGDE